MECIECWVSEWKSARVVRILPTTTKKRKGNIFVCISNQLFFLAFILWCLHEIYGRYFFFSSSMHVCLFVRVFSLFFRFFFARSSDFKAKHLNPLSIKWCNWMPWLCILIFFFFFSFPFAFGVDAVDFLIFQHKIWIQRINKHQNAIKRSSYYITYCTAAELHCQSPPCIDCIGNFKLRHSR